MICLNVNTSIVSICLNTDITLRNKSIEVKATPIVTSLKVDVDAFDVSDVTITQSNKPLNVTCSIVCALNQTEPIFTVYPLDIDIPVMGGTDFVTVTSNRSWELPEGDQIPWQLGDGYITATYNGNGNGNIRFTSDTNQGLDRTQSVKVQLSNSDKFEYVQIKQLGLRETFVASDGYFILDEGTFNVLKV